MGLNEVAVGVPLPWSVAELLRASVHPQALSKIGLLGRNFAGEDALGVGLVHELAPAEGFEEALASMRLHEKDRVAAWVDCWFSESSQRRIRATIAALKAKS